jgi:pantoate--beta-alanine ligase
MGALHKGHMSLIQRSVNECDVTCVSVFVNPTQFNNQQDLLNYPRTLSDDIDLITAVAEDIIIFAPDAQDLYPEGLTSKTYNFGELTRYMEGEHRAGHFDGVGTILEKLFSIIKPDKAYFGEKDFQQLAVVKALVELLDLDIEVMGCETLREHNGLAISSRNKLLNDYQKETASLIYDSLMYAKEQFNKTTPQNIKEEVVKRFKQSEDLNLEYFEIASEKDLKPTDVIVQNEKYRGFISAFSDHVRLIDNMALN